MSFIDWLYLIGALIVSLGGGTAIVAGIVKLSADFLSKRMLDRYNNKHANELEGLKAGYQRELENTKLELEKAKSQFFRYSEKQFELYNDLWRTLVYTRRQANSLWESAMPEKIPAFIEQIRQAKNAVEENLLLIEEDHRQTLDQLMTQFEGFGLGKIKLVDLKNATAERLQAEGITEVETRKTINENARWKTRYDSLITEIGESFRKQIKG